MSKKHILNAGICCICTAVIFGLHFFVYGRMLPKEKAFVEEVTRVTWAKEQESLTGIKQDIRPAFSA